MFKNLNIFSLFSDYTIVRLGYTPFKLTKILKSTFSIYIQQIVVIANDQIVRIGI